MPKGIPATGHRKPGGGRKPILEPKRKKQRSVYLTDAEYAAYLEWIRQRREKGDDR